MKQEQNLRQMRWAIGDATRCIEENLSPGSVQCTFTDPPYNIGHAYGSVSDRLPHERYIGKLRSTFEALFDATSEGGSCFIVHYPKFFLLNLQQILGPWNLHQAITWCYSSNIGHSQKRFTTASRMVVWLSKSEPKFYPEATTQPYKNPTDKRVAKLIADGREGVTLYDWWEIQLTKNVSREKRDYSNQIPSELIRRCILATTGEDDLVVDPFAGTWSTLRVALAENRRAWGCDANPEVQRFL